jgi:hypothetical protein
MPHLLVIRDGDGSCESIRFVVCTTSLVTPPSISPPPDLFPWFIFFGLVFLFQCSRMVVATKSTLFFSLTSPFVPLPDHLAPPQDRTLGYPRALSSLLQQVATLRQLDSREHIFLSRQLLPLEVPPSDSQHVLPPTLTPPFASVNNNRPASSPAFDRSALTSSLPRVPLRLPCFRSTYPRALRLLDIDVIPRPLLAPPNLGALPLNCLLPKAGCSYRPLCRPTFPFFVPRRFWLFALVTAFLTPCVWLTCFCSPILTTRLPMSQPRAPTEDLSAKPLAPRSSPRSFRTLHRSSNTGGDLELEPRTHMAGLAMSGWVGHGWPKNVLIIATTTPVRL